MLPFRIQKKKEKEGKVANPKDPLRTTSPIKRIVTAFVRLERIGRPKRNLNTALLIMFWQKHERFCICTISVSSWPD